MSDPAVTTAWVRAFLDELARGGVEHVCIAPGSRSTPLVMACAREERIRTWVLLDERCAGFFALGLGKATRRPAAVITTSGTATANLFPAVIEASQAGVPLLVLTADRPHELRGTDANQTIDQSRLYGGFVREEFDAGEPSADQLRAVRTLACGALAATLGMDPGPVHVNFPFDKPLEPAELGAEQVEALRAADPVGLDGQADGAPMVPVVGAATGPVDDEVRAVASALAAGGRGLIVAGPVTDPEAVGPAIGALARATGFPVLGDPLSGVRFGEPGDEPGDERGSEPSGEHSVTAYDLFLRGLFPGNELPSEDASADARLREALRPDVVCRIGGAPTSASLLAFLGGLGDVPQVRITSGRAGKDHLGVTSLEVRSEVASFVGAVTEELSARGAVTEISSDSVRDTRSIWRDQWTEIDRAAGQAVCAYRASEDSEPSEGDILAAVVAGVREGTRLFVSNGMPVRDLDAFGGGGKPLRVYGNRGVSGIDGIVSTVAGIAAAGDGPGPVVAVLGDVAFYHDMNGLLAVAEHGLDIVFVLINNDGGGIFHMLPIRDHEPEFTRYFATPHGLDFRHAAELYGIPYRRVDDPTRATDALVEVLAGAGPRILEVRSERDQNQRGHDAVVEAVRGAVRALL
jgi:2-succinyl-5-enolpyruvyl-6-hydroxy-3-cyclohexene-1-carboxylate synthase